MSQVRQAARMHGRIAAWLHASLPSAIRAHDVARLHIVQAQPHSMVQPSKEHRTMPRNSDCRGCP